MDAMLLFSSHKLSAQPLPVAIRLLFVSAFLMNIGLFAIAPFLAVYLTSTLHEPPWQVGSVLGLNLICSQAFPLLTGILGDRTSHRVLLILGPLTRSLGYLGFAFFSSFPLLLLASFCTGTGSALYHTSADALAARQPEAIRIRAFTGINMALNAGAIPGPLLGSLLLLYGARLPFLLGSLLFLGMSILLFSFRQAYRGEEPGQQPPALAGLASAWKQKRFLAFLGILILCWFTYMQLTISLPLYAFQQSHQAALGGLLITINGLSGLSFMLILARQFQRRRPVILLGVGIFCAGLGWLLLPLFPSLLWSIGAVILYTLGETLALPAADLVTSSFAQVEHTGTFFGLSSFSWAIGGTIGSYSGPWLMSQGNVILPWIIYGGAGILAALLLALLEGSRRGQKRSMEHNSHPAG